MPQMLPLEQIRYPLRLAVALILLLPPLQAIGAPPLFARFTTDRQTPYAGEAFQLTLRIYISGGNLDKQVSIGGLPATSEIQLQGFEELPIESVTLDGALYEVRPFRSWARALQHGSLKLAPQLDMTWIQSSRSFFFTQESRRPVRVTAESFSIPVRPRPEGNRPPSFSGLVGRYRFTSVAAPLDIAHGDLITLTATLEGDWIPDTFTMPRLESTPALKAYEMKVAAEESSPTRRVCRQTLVPKADTSVLLPALSLCTFDTRLETYSTQTAGPFPVTFHAERITAAQEYIPKRPTPATGTVPPESPPASPPASGAPLWARFWDRLTGSRDFVVTGRENISVRLAPDDSSRELFLLRPGTVVRQDARREDWIRISCPKGIGWMPGQSVEPIP